MKEQLTYPEALEVLRAAYEQEKIQLTVKISTLEVTISQLQGELDRRDKEVKKDPQPYPYTHPIRNLPEFSKSKRSEPNA